VSHDILSRATNPTQYDLGDVFWANETGLHSPSRRFFFNYLSKYRRSWKGKDILDVGCGAGWLLPLLKKAGAKTIEGVEPSKKNAKMASKTGFIVYNKSFESFSVSKKYDVIVSVMAFGHISDLNAVFHKMNNLLQPNGKILLIVPDYIYFKTKRTGVEVKVKSLNRNEYAALVTREQGKIAEIVRKPIIYEKVASQSGFILEKLTPMLPTKVLIKASLRFSPFAKQPITQLLQFKKV
jgi:2-polyprenyl-3-methyl-5-hydroxy-6-metoxy-1,4-benzoquinol methylase